MVFIRMDTCLDFCRDLDLGNYPLECMWEVLG